MPLLPTSFADPHSHFRAQAAAYACSRKATSAFGVRKENGMNVSRERLQTFSQCNLDRLAFDELGLREKGLSHLV